ncbi:MAG: methionine--tRNA ligase [Candidatus Yanofskybacteria bacterium]|nr:methionine--tRNA ligase [Candidatus Yanofskybacteria bacterium]
MNKYFISTAIPYVNASPHIGFALELIQGDVLARYRRLRGDEVFFINGTDENALKNVQAAEKAGVDVQKFVDQHAQKYIKLSEVLNISNNDFIRTTEERHIKGAQKLWSACKAEDIYKKSYKGLYCIGCEEFKTQKDLIEGVCPEHRAKPEEVEEENYFFKLSKYQDELLRLIESDELKITPSSRKNETLEFIRGGLEDFSISRSRERAKNWGISVPEDDSQIMYVWFDALTNYINALGYGDDDARFKEYWEKGYSAHLVGKGITRFHAIYWPAMLLSAGLALPKEIFVHGYVTVDGEKISKSIGNVVDPFRVVEKYGVDPVRYFLLREIPSGEDGDFSYKKLEDRYNGDLANGLGNLVQRTVTLIENNLSGELIYKPDLLEKEIKEKTEELFKKYIGNLDSFLLHEALGKTWELVGYANKYIDDKKPWAVVKSDAQEFLAIMNNTVFILYNIAWMLVPFMPETADKIFTILGANRDAETLENYKFLVQKGDGLFPRLK